MKNDDCRLSFVGRFKIARQFICREPDDVHRFLSKGIIIKAEHDFYSDSVEYTMFSPSLFRELACGEMVPEYIFVFERDMNDRLEITCEELKR
jgi:hypothetical protein